MNMRKGTFLSVLVPLALLLACEKQPGTVPVTGITLSPDSVELTDGESVTLTATITPSDATNQTVRWSSSSPNITVSNGTVKASFKAGSPTTTVNGKLVLGHGTITAKSEDGGKTAKCTVTVLAKTVAVTGVSLTETSLQLKKGDTHTLKANVQPSDATDKTVKWTSSDTAVATVDQNGLVTAVNSGNATITASAGDISATCAVSVIIPVTSISLSSKNLTLKVGETATLDATILPEDATDKNVLWYSSNPEVASVEGGVITAIGFGQAEITAQINGLADVCSVTVLTDSPDGVIAAYFGGNVTSEDGSTLSGGYLDFGIMNLSTETIRVKTVQLIDGESGTGSELLSIDSDLEAGRSLEKRIDVPAAGIYSPTAVFTYTYRGEEYTCSAKYFEDIVKVRRRP